MEYPTARETVRNLVKDYNDLVDEKIINLQLEDYDEDSGRIAREKIHLESMKICVANLKCPKCGNIISTIRTRTDARNNMFINAVTHRTCNTQGIDGERILMDVVSIADEMCNDSIEFSEDGMVTLAKKELENYERNE